MVASNVGFDSEMHDPKSFRYLDLSKGNSASGSSFRQTICGSGIRRDTKVCGEIREWIKEPWSKSD